MRSIIIVVLLQALCFTSQAQQPATVKEYTKTFTTYPFSDPNPIALSNAVYPYFRYDGFTDKPVNKEWRVVELQNDYISIMILPEIGGKIWAATERKTGRPFIYYNHAVKFRDVAMRGPWTSGGLEANYGIIGHTPNCATPVDYTTTQNEDGSVSCIIGVLDLLTRSNWRIEINLPKDKAYFSTRSFWYNSTAQQQPYYHWMNLGLKAKGNLEFVFPGTHYIGHNGEYAEWPLNKDNGKQLNFYEQNDFGGYKSYHVTGKLADFWGAYYHDDANGMVRYGNYDDKLGRKIWIWGLSRQGMIWEKMLTDTDGQYVELQSGRLFNQNSPRSSYTPFKQVSFAPYATDTWTEYWYPISKTRGIAAANQYGALNTVYENGWLKIYFSAVQSVNDSIIVTAGDQKIYSKTIKLAPLETFSDSVQLATDPGELQLSIGGSKLQYNSNPDHLRLNRPVEPLPAFDWKSAQGLYTEAQQLFDQKNYKASVAKLDSALKKEPGYQPALLLKAIMHYRSLQYAEALSCILKCLQVNAHDGASNYYYGLTNARLGNITDATDGFSAATLSQEYKTAAYTELARLQMLQKLYSNAIDYADKAIVYNQYNIDAHMIRALAFRKNNQLAEAAAALETIRGYDPLNHFARYETSLLQPTEANKKAFAALIRNELPTESYAELAIWYYNNGAPVDCVDVFTLCPPSAEARYWLAYLDNTPADCSKIDPFLAFPFRQETGTVLQQLLTKQHDWLLKYQLALLYRDKNRLEECKELLRSCADQPDFPAFYAVRADVFKEDAAQSLQDLQKAVSLNAKEWRFKKLLAEYYLNHQQADKALSITAAFYKANPEHYIMGMLYAKSLMENLQFQQADLVLSKLNIIPFEGATEGRLLYREAKLMQAIAAIKNKRNAAAAKFIGQSRLWPESLGVGKPYDADIDTRLEDWMEYLSVKDKNSAAAKNLLKKITDFEPKVDNTVPNFIASNALISAWAIEKASGKTAAEQWLNQQLKAFPEFENVLAWCLQSFSSKGAADNKIHSDGNIRILQAIEKM